MTMMSALPNHLVEEILSLIPLRSMRAVRLTCKKWNNQFKSRSFITMHKAKQEASAKESGESRMIVMLDHNVCLMSVNENEIPSAKSLGKLTCLHNVPVKISQVFHCDGLVLCILKDDISRPVVWNPYLGQTRWIKPTYSHELGKYKNRYKYAIGYEDKKSCRSYKILRFRDLRYGYISNENHRLFYETYDFESNVWTTHYFSGALKITFYGRGVSLKGNTYWCATVGQIRYTVCFDFTRMRFGGLQDLPFHVSLKQPVTHLSCVRDEKLSVLVQSKVTFPIDIWITDKIDEQKVSWGKSLRVDDKATKVSWSKFLTVNMGPFTDLGLGISYGGFFIEEEKKVAMFLNKDRELRTYTMNIFGKDGYFAELDLGLPLDKRCWLVSSYVPSLVQIKLPGVGKRSRQSD